VRQILVLDVVSNDSMRGFRSRTGPTTSFFCQAQSYPSLVLEKKFLGAEPHLWIRSEFCLSLKGARKMLFQKVFQFFEDEVRFAHSARELHWILKWKKH
jgi:hypothetical protein